jgi:hypothetical protein
MKKTIAKKWIKALRSGKYAKTTGQLCRVAQNGNKSYCCLGVLTELYNKEHAVKESLIGNDLPYSVSKWAGMGSEIGIIAGSGHYSGQTLADLNDCPQSKRSFMRIADIIERNVENL